MKNQTRVSNKSIAKHTPGPWRSENQFSCKILNENGVCVAVPHGPEGRWVDVKEEHEANARLIAAAPELLNALKAMIHYHGECDFQCKEVQICKHEMARQAIAKAEGR